MQIVIIDPHPIFRAGLRTVVEARLGCSVVAEMATVQEAMASLARSSADLVTLEAMLPDGDGISLVRALRTTIGARFLMLTRCDDFDAIGRALATGASGYALKQDPIEATLDAVRLVGNGESYIAPSLRVSFDDGSIRPSGSSGLSALSPREREVFNLVVRGLTGPEIAKSLFISHKTVESHRFKINKKLGVHSVGALIRYAALHGLPLA